MKDTQTDRHLNAKIAQWHVGLLYVIKKHGLYYRENAHGYTGNVSEAWKVPLDVAQKHEYIPLGCQDPVTIELAPRPDYCSDLNAIRAAVDKLPDGPFAWWSNHLMQIVGTHLKAVNAGPRERAEALVALIESGIPIQ